MLHTVKGTPEPGDSGGQRAEDGVWPQEQKVESS